MEEPFLTAYAGLQPSILALVLCLQPPAIFGFKSSSVDGGKTSKILKDVTFKSCSQCQYTRWQHLCCVHMWHFLIYKGVKYLVFDSLLHIFGGTAKHSQFFISCQEVKCFLLKKVFFVVSLLIMQASWLILAYFAH